MAKHRHGGVVPLKELDDFELADYEPDVRGWEVLSADGATIGKVEELLADPSVRKVRYLDVELEEEIARDERHVLIPIGAARLHEKDDRVYVNDLDARAVSTLPRYQGGPVDPDYEQRVHGGFGVPPASADRPYEHRIFDDREFYDSRAHRL
ncbi:MAG: PRC-barrel domain-containing protein [Longimicrobiales bacterium]